MQHVSAYALAGTERRPNPEWRRWLVQRFRDGGYRIRPLLAAIVRSPNFYAVERPVMQTASLPEETHR